MRQDSSNRRPRSRHSSNRNDRSNRSDRNDRSSGNGGGSRVRSAASLRHQSFDSNCGELRVKGTAWQVYEKYQVLARDSASSGDRILAENYLQHAEHYYRIIKAIEEATMAEHNEQRSRQEYGKPQPASAEETNESSEEGTESTNTEQTQSEAIVQKIAPVGQTQTGSESPFYTQDEIEEHNKSAEQKACLSV